MARSIGCEETVSIIVRLPSVAPNTPETYESCKPEIESFLTEVLGNGDFTLEHSDDPRRRFGVIVKTSEPFDLEAIVGAAK